MAFEKGDLVQPVRGGQVMSVIKVENDVVFCGPPGSGEVDSKPFAAVELALYHEDGDFGVC
jgi:hypothetical protein